MHRQMMMGMLALLACAGAGWLEAGEVTYWKNGIESPQRSQDTVEGIIEKWDWKGGVTIKNWQDQKVQIARKDVIYALRDDQDRSERLADAIAQGDIAALREIASATGGSELDREEAAWEATQIATGSGVQAGIDALGKFIAAWGEGNFADVSRSMLAELYVDARKSNEAIPVLEACAGLGTIQAARSLNRIGQLKSATGDFAEALKKFEGANEPAKKAQAPIQQMVALAWGGEAALALGDKAKAKAYFDAALKAEAGLEVDFLAKGIALKGLSDLGSDATESYLGYLRAAYWLDGNEREGQCIISALKIADANKSANDKLWTTRAARLTEVAERQFKTQLDAYKKSQGTKK